MLCTTNATFRARAARLAAVAWIALSVSCGSSGGSQEQAQGAVSGGPAPAAAGSAAAARAGEGGSAPAASGGGGKPGSSTAASGGAGAAAAAPAAGAAGAQASAGTAAAAGAGGVQAAPSGAAGAPDTASAAGSGASAPAGGALPKVTTTDGPGPFATTVDLSTGPMRRSGLFRPEELGKDGVLHPVFVWGCGGMAMPSSYMAELTEIASHGFVVIAEVSNIGDDGAPLLAALDWITAENERADSELYQKLNTSRIGLGGHSIGSVNSFLAGPDPRWFTTVHVAGGSLDNVNDPSAPTTGMGGKSLIHPTAYVCSESDIFGNVEKTEKDYANTTVPVFFTVMEGAEHIGAVGEGLPVIIAWLRWQLGDEAERRADFLEPMGMFASGRYKSQTKNW